MKSLVHTEELCSLSVPLEHAATAKFLVCIGLKGLLCGMTLPSAVVPQKKEVEPPNQNASQIARIHINITILGGMDANGAPRRSKQYNKRD